VHIKGGGCNEGFASAGLETHISPLLPLAQPYTVAECAGWVMVKNRQECRQVASSGKRMLNLHVICEQSNKPPLPTFCSCAKPDAEQMGMRPR
jgi:hypothetical protein